MSKAKRQAEKELTALKLEIEKTKANLERVKTMKNKMAIERYSFDLERLQERYNRIYSTGG